MPTSSENLLPEGDLGSSAGDDERVASVTRLDSASGKPAAAKKPAKRARSKSAAKPEGKASKGAKESKRSQRTRQERSQQTRQALLDAALDQLENQNFGGISMREVARAAGITPTAFYRHFESMDELGLVLVDDSFRSLREMLRIGRGEVAEATDAIQHPVGVLSRHVKENQAHFRFIARERFGGKAALRRAIGHEIRLFSSELGTDLARYPVLRELEPEVLQMMSSLIVSMMVSTVEALLEVPPGRTDLSEVVERRALQQLTMIVVGGTEWMYSPLTSSSNN